MDRARQRLVLTVRGSLELGDLLTDLHAKPIAVHLPCLEGEAYVHEGMLRAAAFVHCNTAETLARAARDYPGWPLFVTGHSLGGGVAALVAVLMRQPGGAPEELQVCLPLCALPQLRGGVSGGGSRIAAAAQVAACEEFERQRRSAVAPELHGVLPAGESSLPWLRRRASGMRVDSCGALLRDDSACRSVRPCCPASARTMYLSWHTCVRNILACSGSACCHQQHWVRAISTSLL